MDEQNIFTYLAIVRVLDALEQKVQLVIAAGARHFCFIRLVAEKADESVSRV